MKDFIITLASGLGGLLFASIVVSLGNIIHVKCEQIKQKTNNQALIDLIDKFDHIVQISVEATNQTFVVDKKLKSEFTDDDKDIALNKTLESIEAMLTDEDKQRIIENFGDLASFIKNSVETYIIQSKEQ